jgi:hypothetical protein
LKEAREKKEEAKKQKKKKLKKENRFWKGEEKEGWKSLQLYYLKPCLNKKTLKQLIIRPNAHKNKTEVQNKILSS